MAVVVVIGGRRRSRPTPAAPEATCRASVVHLASSRAAIGAAQHSAGGDLARPGPGQGPRPPAPRDHPPLDVG